MPTTISGSAVTATTVEGAILKLTGGISMPAASTFAVRAWVTFTGAGSATVLASGNVSSVTRNGTGSYTINFSTPMTDVNYAVIGTSQYYGGFDTWVEYNGNSLSSTNIAVVRQGATQDSTFVSVIIVR